MRHDPLRVLIVDDEMSARKRLRILCDARPDVTVVGMADSGEEAVALVQAASPDLLLLDIAMPGLNGFAVARRLSEGDQRPVIVFHTAHDSYALAAFDADAADYLLKPVSAERLARAIERARRHRQLPEHDAVAPFKWIEALWVPHQGAMRRIAVTDIERIESEDDYIRLVTAERSYLLHEAIARLEKKLDPATFVRVRRSVIVNRSRLAGLRHDGLGVWSALLVEGSELRIGPTYLAAVKALMRK